MSFIAPAFPAFLLVVLLVHIALRAPRARNAWLVCASLVFYGAADARWPLLLVFSTMLDFHVARALGRFPARRRALIGASVLGNLGVLAVFKYFDFFSVGVADMLGLLGVGADPLLLGVALPAGISFFTFQTLGYTLDVAAGRVKARDSLVDYAAYVCFFPQLVAGPIERADRLLPQLERHRPWRWSQAASGLGLFAWGAAQKVVIADTAALYVDRVFAMPDPGPNLTWAAAGLFAVQILADFGGYTDMARGLARLFGVELVENFHWPYAARNPADFWRRWHASLTGWMAAHVYRPLRGASPGALRRQLAAGATLLLVGLWHGAGWNFLVWGAWFALVLWLWRLLGAVWAPLGRWTGPPLTFFAVLVGMLLFRESSPARAWALVSGPDRPDQNALVWLILGVLLAGAGGLVLGGWLRRRAVRGRWDGALMGAGVAVCTLLVFIFLRDTTRDFVYFRF